MFKIREVKIGSGKTAVQVYYLNNRKRIFVKHIGSAMTKEDLVHLKQQARQFIEDYSG
ncbi:MAG: hypothetical protein PWR20_788, partial [Bacteroidales bacterium]|nr:hypothetical protein [Bacteroidales bacterium]